MAILGANGCGKSTLVRHLNGLLALQEGKLRVLHLDASKEKDVWALRRMCGMVFQNPDSQFVSSVIEEDIAFGLHNYDVAQEEIPGKVRAALSIMDLEGFEKKSPHALSGGQKQRLAMAGVLALEPEILILDEATSMLDPQGKKEVMQYLKKLNQLGKTIIMVTHDAEEAKYADQVILMEDGVILQSGSAKEILTDTALLRKAHLKPPISVRMYEYLAERGLMLDGCPLMPSEFVRAVGQLKGGDRRCSQ